MKFIVKPLLLTIILTTISLAQTGTRLVDFNAGSIGRGGTSIGVFDSPDLMMTNPAGISFLNSSMLDVNLSLMFPSVHFKNKINDADGDKNTFPLPALGYVNKCSNSKFSWGVGFYTAGGMGADFSLRHALYMNQDGSYNTQTYHSKLATMQGGFTAAYKFDEKFSVGISAHLVYSMLEFGMPYSLNPMIMNGTAMPGMTFGMMFSAPQALGGFGYDEVTATAKMSELTAIGFNGKIGFAYKVDEKLSFGLSYTLPTSLTYKNGKASMDMTAQLNDAFGKAVMGWLMQNPGKTQLQAQTAIMAQFGQLGIDMSKGAVANYNLDVDLTFPQSIGFGVSYQALPNLKLAADVEWLSWEKAFDKMTLKLTSGNNSNINKMIGSSSMNIDFPMNWKNSLNIKIGGELNATKELTLRLGYAYNTNPVPETTIFPIFPAVVENHVMLGAGYQVSNSILINAAVEMAFKKSMQAGSSSIIANEYDGSASDLSTMLIHAGMKYSF